MTARLPQPASDRVAVRVAGHMLCQLVDVTLTDGSSLRFTDLDHNITVMGATYSAASAGSFTAERREATQRAGDQEFGGLIDGTRVKILDLAGGKYRGARIVQRLVDRRWPWIPFMSTVKVVTNIDYTTNGWTARVKSLSSRLDESRGGRFSGVNSPTCLYQFGGPFCKKDISALINVGVRASTITSPRAVFGTVSTTWKSAPLSESKYREGDMTWRWSAPLHTGTLTTAASAGDIEILDVSKSFADDELVGKEVRILSGANGYVKEYFRIFANGASAIDFEGALAASYPIGTHYDVCGFCANFGVTVPIAKATSSYDVSLFFPTPSLLASGDSGIVTPGCDGLKTTCKNVHDNLINHGGIDVDAPTPGDIIRTPEEE